MVLNIHELWPLCGLRGTVLVLSEKQEQHVLKFSNNFSMTPRRPLIPVHSHNLPQSQSQSQFVSVRDGRVTCGQCGA